ncbi:MAG: GNAT family N-acetyltransferase [Lachnospiraceae bacterium]|nr:GNAT family N-acetyltransferase [Lachnospiraceae bacterium]
MPEEYGVLEDFLYEAIFQREGEEKLPRDIVKNPELRVYTDDFGKKTDCGLVAVADGHIIGAVWTRIIAGYGSVDDQTPEFAISLYPKYRGKGIGTALMKKMVEILKEKGYEKASLAVQKDNYALRMYQKVGFQTIRDTDEEYIMICQLNEK